MLHSGKYKKTSMHGIANIIKWYYQYLQTYVDEFFASNEKDKWKLIAEMLKFTTHEKFL